MALTYLGNPILRATAVPVVDYEDPAVEALAHAMVETMIVNHGVGLAAPQIGEGRRIIVFRVPPERAESEEAVIPVHVLLNPEIVPLSEETELGLEGCLSLPGLRGMVPRFLHIGYRGYDLDGQLIEHEAKGFHARVVQHEVDHLNGVMYLDRMSDFSSLQHESEIRRRLLREAKEVNSEEES